MESTGSSWLGGDGLRFGRFQLRGKLKGFLAGICGDYGLSARAGEPWMESLWGEDDRLWKWQIYDTIYIEMVIDANVDGIYVKNIKQIYKCDTLVYTILYV